MSGIRFWLWCVVFAGLVCGAPNAWAETADRTLSPYLVVEHADPKLDRLPLQSTKVEIAVTNAIADVTVSQVYKNDGQRAIDARYVFPASTRAAVHGMRMVIRDQVIEAEIQERQQAKRTFERAKEAGKSATLLEQERPNVFSMSVANVLPGDRIAVTLRYTELVVPTEGTYELVYPTVVGPRYSNAPEARAPAANRWVKSPYLGEGHGPTSTFELAGTLSSGIPIGAVESSTHRLTETRDNPNLVRFALDDRENRGNNRDFVLRYRLAGDVIQSGLALYDGGREKFFLLQVEPPARVTDDDLPPREYVLVVDVSGSMVGFPLDTAKGLLRDLLGGLRPVDSFNLVLFSGSSASLAPRSLPATPANVARAIQLLDRQQGGGGTELLPALTHAWSIPRQKGLARSFIVVTDGYVAADREAIRQIRSHLGEANVFAFGIGSGVNRYLIEGLARAGMGEPFVVTEPGEAADQARAFRNYVRAPLLTDVQVSYQGFDVTEVEPRGVPSLLASRPIVIFGQWRGQPKGTIVLSAMSARGPYQQRFEVAGAVPRAENRALAYLWARTRIANLADHGFGTPSDAEKKELTALGLRYGLLTEFTSFVAVSRTVRDPAGPGTDVDQPLPLPLGVTNSAVGTQPDSASEPELAWLLALLLLGGGSLFAVRRRWRLG
jgi:Ca-activated chloride channel homolog